MILVASRAKRPVELFLGTNPNPQPYVGFKTPRNSSVISCNPHRPCAWRVSHALKAQAGIRRGFRKANVSCAHSRSDRRRQSVGHLPKFGSALRDHAFSSKSLSRMTGNCSGSARYRASISSKNFSNFGRGAGSFKILLHSASPSSSGTSFGRESANFDRSAGVRLRMASSISSTVLTFYRYNTGCSPATRNAPPRQETRPTSLPFEGACNMTGPQHRCRPGLPTRRGMRVPLAR